MKNLTRVDPSFCMEADREYFRFEPSLSVGVISSPECNIITKSFGKEIISATLESFTCWNIRTGSALKSWNDLDNKSPVTCLKLSHIDSEIIAVGHEDGSIRIWNLKEAESRIVFRGHKTAVTALCFSPDGSRLASGARDTDVVLWDFATETGLFRLRGHNNLISNIEFLTENYLITSSKDSLIKLWDLQAQHCIETEVSHRSEVTGFILTQDMKFMLTVGADGFLRIFSVDFEALGKKLIAGEVIGNVFIFKGEVQRSSKDRALCISHLPEDFTFSVLSSDRSVEVFRFASIEDVKKKLQRRRKRQKEKGVKEEEVEVSVESGDLIKSCKYFRLHSRARFLDFIPEICNENHLGFIVGYATNQIETLAVELENAEEEPKVLNSIDLPGHRSDVKVVALTTDSSMAMTASSESVKVWNTSSGACIRTIDCDDVLCGTFVQKNEYLLLGTKQGLLRAFDLASGCEMDPVEAHSGPIWSIAMRPDRKGFATGSADKFLKFWEFKTSSTRAEGFKLKNIRSLQVSDDVLCVKYSPDCRFVAVSLLDLTVKIFFEDTLKFYSNLFGHKLPVMSFDFSHDSRLIITASADKNVKIWGLDFGDCRKSVFAHQEAITGVCFLPVSYQFLTCSKDGLVKYWTDDQYAMLQKLDGHKKEVWGMALSSRGDTLVTVSSDRSIRIWRKGNEQIFVEEEKERQMEEMIEASMLNDNAHDEATEKGEEVGSAVKKSMDSLRATERLADAIDAADEETEKWDAYEVAKKLGTIGVTEPVVGPYFQSIAKGMTPAQFVMRTLEQIPASEIELALLTLPFTHIKSLLTYIESWIGSNLSIGLTSRVLALLIRLYYNQIITDSKLRVRLEKVRCLQQEKLVQYRDLLGLNSCMLKAHLSHLETEKSRAFA
jgi:U3 small nucleolar RNA-associated protein 12